MPALAVLLSEMRRAEEGCGVSIDAILDAVRRHLGMEIAFASRVADGQRRFTHIRAEIPFAMAPGDAEPLDASFCQRVLDGRLPHLIHDAAEDPVARNLPPTAALPIGAHLSVPLILSDGTIYGTFCCLSRHADHSLNERDLETLRAFAELAAVQIEREMAATRNVMDRRSEIAGLIAAGGPVVHFQPIHRIDDGTVAGVEALARFPGAEARCPSQLFADAHAAGLGVELELAAVRQAVVAAQRIRTRHYVSVNVSPETLLADGLEPLLKAAPRGRMVVELTEHARVASYPEMRERLDRLRGHVRIAIDDVGAGYAAMRHIIDLAPDIIKLDIELIRDIDSDLARQALVSAMVTFAARIEACVVAEGVETAEEQAMLAELGIAYAQGWRFSRAMPLDTVRRWLSPTEPPGGAGAVQPGHQVA